LGSENVDGQLRKIATLVNKLLPKFLSHQRRLIEGIKRNSIRDLVSGLTRDPSLPVELRELKIRHGVVTAASKVRRLARAHVTAHCGIDRVSVENRNIVLSLGANIVDDLRQPVCERADRKHNDCENKRDWHEKDQEAAASATNG
jgi:hypothetical protein